MPLIATQKVHLHCGDDASWMENNVPLFECPDVELEEIYYFRWSVYRKHIKATPDGFVVTEFLPQVHWAGKYNTISAAAAHHIYEGRWLRDHKPLDDYCRFWFRGGGSPRAYSAPLADAIWARALATGDFALPVELLPDLVANYEAWVAERQGEHGLFWQVDDREGEEFTIGGSGYRPPINAYMFADAGAIANIAQVAGNTALARQFQARALVIKLAVQEHLWDKDVQCFKTRGCAAANAAHEKAYSWAPENRANLLPEHWADVREIFGLVPWAYNLPDPGYEVAWRQLFDPAGFAGEFGPTTAERRHPRYMQAHGHDCLWNGPSWPFVTTQVLKGLANLLHHYAQDEMTREDYLRLLQTYARSQYLRHGDGTRQPWIDESLHPDSGEWLTRASLQRKGAPDWERGRDYNHSGFCDLVITGLAGLIPQADGSLRLDPLIPEDSWDYWCLENIPYHGQLLTLTYDRDGTRYGRGPGVQITRNGRT